MEFFDWINVVQIFTEYFTVATVSSAAEYVQVVLRILYISVGVAGGLYLICLILGGLGMHTMAKKVGMKHSWLAFLPLANTWYAGKLAGETRLFGQKMKRAGLYATLAEIVYIGINVFALVVQFALYRPEYLERFNETEGGSGIFLNVNNIPLSLRWLVVANSVLSWVNVIAYLALILFFCAVFFAFFRKYYARSPFLMTFLCAVLPLRGIVIFAVRNNTPVDYDAYMRRKMQQYAARQGNPYGGQGGYGEQGYDIYGNRTDGGTPPKQDEPFSDFGDSSAPASGAGGQGNAEGGSGSGNADGNNPFPDF